MNTSFLKRSLLGMALLVVLAGPTIAQEPAPANPLALDAKAVKDAGIVLDKAGVRALGDELKAPGEVKADAYSTVLVSPRVESQVLARKAKLGDVVKAGAPLVVLSAVQVAETQGALIVAEQDWQRIASLGPQAVSARRYNEAKVQRDQARAKLRAYGLSDGQIGGLLRKGSAGADGSFELLAPAAGRVTTDEFLVGERVEPGRTLAFTPLRTLSALDAPAGFAVTGKSSGPVLAAATGQFAPGLAADQLTRGSDGPLRGLALQPCGPAVSDAWFIGGGPGVGRTTTLYLSNVEDQPSLVDVRMYGAAGELDVPAARGVVVPPHRRVVLALGKIAPAQSTLAVRVIAREGRVSPAVFDNTVAGSQPQGIEYLPLTEARRRIVLPAVLAGEGTRELTLLAPRADAEVRVSMLTQDGAITPVGLESVSLQAGKVTRVRIEQVTAKAGVGLVLRARTPLVGAVRAVLPGQLPDTADVAGTPVLDAAAVVTGITSGRSTALILAAPRKAARVRLTVHAVGGPKRAPVTRELAVASGTTLRATVTVPSGASSAWVLLEPVAGSGPVHAVRRVAESGTRGVLVTTAPVLPLTPRVAIPTALFRAAAS